MEFHIVFVILSVFLVEILKNEVTNCKTLANKIAKHRKEWKGVDDVAYDEEKNGHPKINHSTLKQILIDQNSKTEAHVVEELEKLVEDELVSINKINENPFSTNLSSFALNEYHRFDEISNYIQALAENYDKIASIFKVGLTSEGRTVRGIKIGNKNQPNKKSIFIDAGIHAREWIAPAACLYIINTLLAEYETNSTVQKVVDNVNWYFVPSANPDGYEYSWTSDRMWRKTRSRQSCNSFRCCYGVDPNRNWDYHWGESGTSTDPCSELYEGTHPFSEPETLSLSKFITSLKDDLKAYISLHGYGQLWLVPYGYQTNSYSPDFNELYDLAKTAEAALENVHGNKYTVENAADLYPASGSSDDWAKGVAGVKYSYTIELRPGNLGENDDGFILPSTEIVPTGQELFAGLLTVAEKIL